MSLTVSIRKSLNDRLYSKHYPATLNAREDGENIIFDCDIENYANEIDKTNKKLSQKLEDSDKLALEEYRLALMQSFLFYLDPEEQKKELDKNSIHPSFWGKLGYYLLLPCALFFNLANSLVAQTLPLTEIIPLSISGGVSLGIAVILAAVDTRFFYKFEMGAAKKTFGLDHLSDQETESYLSLCEQQIKTLEKINLVMTSGTNKLISHLTSKEYETHAKITEKLNQPIKDLKNKPTQTYQEGLGSKALRFVLAGAGASISIGSAFFTVKGLAAAAIIPALANPIIFAITCAVCITTFLGLFVATRLKALFYEGTELGKCKEIKDQLKTFEPKKEDDFNTIKKQKIKLERTTEIALSIPKKLEHSQDDGYNMNKNKWLSFSFLKNKTAKTTQDDSELKRPSNMLV